MINSLLPYLIVLQICVGLFHAGMGLDYYHRTNILDIQNFFILALALSTLWVYFRIRSTSPEHRSWKIIFEHAIFIGVLAWFFHETWWSDWELFLVFFLSINTVILLLILIFESQFWPLIGYRNWWISDFFWSIGSFLTLINCISLSLIFIFTYESLATIWIFFGVSWFFLWKQDFR